MCFLKSQIDFVIRAKNDTNPYLQYTVADDLLHSPALYDGKDSDAILQVELC